MILYKERGLRQKNNKVEGLKGKGGPLFGQRSFFKLKVSNIETLLA